MAMASLYEVIVLFDGYSKVNTAGTVMNANCSCTLLRGSSNVIIDTMTAWDGDRIANALKENDLAPADINWLICTHGHSDHIGNNNLFQNATHIVGNSISKYDAYHLHDFQQLPTYHIDNALKVLATPGHTLSDVSIIVEAKGKFQGTVAITGDLFENVDDIQNENIWMEAGSDCPETQRKNRKYIISIADYVVPGHGSIFAVTQEMRNLLNY